MLKALCSRVVRLRPSVYASRKKLEEFHHIFNLQFWCIWEISELRSKGQRSKPRPDKYKKADAYAYSHVFAHSTFNIMPQCNWWSLIAIGWRMSSVFLKFHKIHLRKIKTKFNAKNSKAWVSVSVSAENIWNYGTRQAAVDGYVSACCDLDLLIFWPNQYVSGAGTWPNFGENIY